MRVDKQYLTRFLQAVADGYDVKVIENKDDFIVAVESPYFKEDNGSDMYLVLEIKK